MKTISQFKSRLKNHRTITFCLHFPYQINFLYS